MSSPHTPLQPRYEFPYYLLKIYVNSQDPILLEKYRDAVLKRQQLIHTAQQSWVKHHVPVHFDAGFDLFVPPESDAISNTAYAMTINHKVHASMDHVYVDEHNASCYFPTAYYIHPRSSLGTKTPWRLANSAGIIDSGYRGGLIGAFDHRGSALPSLHPPAYTRLLQICGPDLKHPIFPVLVNSLEELGHTERGAGGFGSTGV